MTTFDGCPRNRFPAGENNFCGFCPGTRLPAGEISSAKLYNLLYNDFYKELLMGAPEIVFQPVKITSADSVPEIVFQPVKKTSADSVPELVFQPVKITSADSAGQCQHSIAFSISVPESAQ